MKTKSIGIVLIVIGVVMTIYTGFNYVTTEKVVDIGPIQISHEKNNPVQWAPIVGIVILAAGAFLVVKDSTNKG
jgi:drug/metabolite transporter (DMT)-like permease